MIIEPSKEFDLRKISTKAPEGIERERAKTQAKAYGAVIGDFAEMFAASSKHALLVIFQGMDASGKDGAVKAAFGQCSPINLQVTSWKKPTEIEARHDFLWRVHQAAPAKGNIAIWNRSHYEDVLIQRVHGWISEETVNARFEAINAFERNLQADNHTVILKFLLHTSKEEQAQQLQERIDEPNKHHKHNPSDWVEREHWDAYMDAYSDVLKRSEIPWYVIPTDNRWFRDYAIARAVRDALESLKLEWPPLADQA